MSQQCDGVVLGSPLVILPTKFYMGIVEELVFSNSAVPSIYCFYVDDTFIQVSREEDLHVLRNDYITNCSLNFTCESSDEGELPFLDVKVQQENDSFKTQVGYM